MQSTQHCTQRHTRNIKTIAEAHFPGAAKIFSEFEVNVKNLVSLGSASKHCEPLPTYLHKVDVKGKEIYGSFDPPTQLVNHNMVSMGLLTAEMITKRKNYYKDTNYNFPRRSPHHTSSHLILSHRCWVMRYVTLYKIRARN